MMERALQQAVTAGETPLHRWAERLEQLISEVDLFERVTVLAETDSTQDAARRLRAAPGHIIATGRQTAGRGRHGRRWLDDEHAHASLAVSFVLPPERPERLAIVMGVATAEAIGAVLGDVIPSCTADHAPAVASTAPAESEQSIVGIKWPNDIIALERKLAGILIEQDDQRAVVGVGINVGQRPWPSEIAGHAISMHEVAIDRGATLAQAAGGVERLAVLAALVQSLEQVWTLPSDELVARWLVRDTLTGREATFGIDGRVLRGRVIGIDPMHGLEVETAGVADHMERQWLPAAVTTRIT